MRALLVGLLVLASGCSLSRVKNLDRRWDGAGDPLCTETMDAPKTDLGWAIASAAVMVAAGIAAPLVKNPEDREAALGMVALGAVGAGGFGSSAKWGHGKVLDCRKAVAHHRTMQKTAPEKVVAAIAIQKEEEWAVTEAKILEEQREWAARNPCAFIDDPGARQICLLREDLRRTYWQAPRYWGPVFMPRSYVAPRGYRR